MSLTSPTDVVIYFEHDNITISQRGRHTLEIVVAESLREARNDGAPPQLVLEGHTDRTGSQIHNLALSRRRAVAVRDHLVALGYPPTALSVEGYGESSPYVPTADEVPEADNRRVLIRFVTGRRAGLCAGPLVCGARN